MTKMVIIKLTNKRGTFYVTKIENGYPFKTRNEAEARIYSNKAMAIKEIKSIKSSNIGWTDNYEAICL